MAAYRIDLPQQNRTVALAMALALPLGPDAALAIGDTLSKPLIAEAKRRRRIARRKLAELAEIIIQVHDGEISAGTYTAAELYAIENCETVEEMSEMIARWEAWERMYGPAGPAPVDLYDLADEYDAPAVAA